MKALTRLELFRSALEKCEAYSAQEPGGWLWPALIEQLSYLIELELGRSTDRGLLSKICVGAMAAKNIEDFDLQLAQTLYDVQAASEDMLTKEGKGG
jgi:hypothetical protein